MKTALFTITLLLATPLLAQALQLTPGTEHTLRGEVASMQPDQMFFMRSGDDRVLVYASAAQMKLLRVGDRIEVHGTVPQDWVKLARLELQAIDVKAQ